MRFGLSFTRKLRFYHGKRSFLKTLGKVEISENSVFTFTFTFSHFADALIQSDLQ